MLIYFQSKSAKTIFMEGEKMITAEKNTDKLFQMIETAPEAFIDNIESEKLGNSESMFIEYFYKLMEDKGITVKQLVFKTAISQSHLYQIASGRRHLSRDTAIILSFAMELDLEQTQKFLRYSNNAMLYPKVKRDAIIICCIGCNMTYEQTNETLLKKSEKGLVA